MNHVRPWKGEEWDGMIGCEAESRKLTNQTNKITIYKSSRVNLINWNGAFYEELRDRRSQPVSHLSFVALIAWHEHIRQPRCLAACLATSAESSAARPVGRLSGHRLAGIIIIFIKLRGSTQRRDWSESVVCAQSPATSTATPTPTVIATAALTPSCESNCKSNMPVAQCNALVFLLQLRYENTFLSLVFPGPHVVHHLSKFSVFFSHFRLVNKSFAFCNPIKNWR